MLRIAGKASGESAKPLEQVTLTGVGRGTVSVRDALGREYFHAKAAKGARFRVGGALGRHTVAVKDGRKATRTLTFPVAARTEIEDDGGRFAELLQVLLATMLRQRIEYRSIGRLAAIPTRGYAPPTAKYGY